MDAEQCFLEHCDNVGVHVLTIPNFVPATLNQLLGNWRKRARLKKLDREMVATYARLQEIPKATGKRRVSLRIGWGDGKAGRRKGGGRRPDPEAFWKSVNDSLVSCGLLTDDNEHGVELGPVEYVAGERRTEVVLTEV